jgi:hypothetical protein
MPGVGVPAGVAVGVPKGVGVTGVSVGLGVGITGVAVGVNVVDVAPRPRVGVGVGGVPVKTVVGVGVGKAGVPNGGAVPTGVAVPVGVGLAWPLSGPVGSFVAGQAPRSRAIPAAATAGTRRFVKARISPP